MTSWLCRFGWHKWSMWSAPFKGSSIQHATKLSSPAMIQDRHCLNCNKITLRFAR